MFNYLFSPVSFQKIVADSTKLQCKTYPLEEIMKPHTALEKKIRDKFMGKRLSLK